jgi:hypothetical protein
MSMHYLPAQTVTREYEERVVLRGEDLRMVRNILRVFGDCIQDPSEEEIAFIDRFLAATAVTEDGNGVNDEGYEIVAGIKIPK